MPAVSSAKEFRTKTQVAYEQIHSWILRGDLAPGEVVDQERLASLLDISRMPLRQALTKLEAEGLIEVRAHRSAVISPLRPSEIEELYATRAALEAMLADVGSSRCTLSDVEEMREIVRAMERAESSNSLDEFVDLDRRFHGLLYRASGYARACEMVERLRNASDRYVRYYASHQAGAAKSLQDHKALLVACAGSSRSRVRKLTEEHILHGKEALLQMIEPAHRGRHQGDMK